MVLLANRHTPLTGAARSLMMTSVQPKPMTKYDKLMDVIKDHLYAYYVGGMHKDDWVEADAQESAKAILEAVEEYQSSPLIKSWRASD